MDQVHKLRLFAASPSDVRRDRESVRDVVTELNDGVARDKGLVLEVVTGENVAPGIGRPEQVILDQIGEFDVFIGVMGRRFGTPTGEYEGGTEEEFYTAYNRFMAAGVPRVLFYFNRESGPPPETEADIEQLAKVIRFREALSDKALFREYDSSSSFLNYLRRDLTSVLRTWDQAMGDLARDAPSSLRAQFWPIWRDANLDGRAAHERVESCLYRSARSCVKFMTISGRSIYSSEVEETLARKPKDFTMKLLLFDWNSPHFEAKMRDERRQILDDVGAARVKGRNIAQEFVQLSETVQCSLQVKLYSDYPVWRLLIVDHRQAHTGYYPRDKRGYEGPMFLFESSDETGLFYPMNQYFDVLWETAGEPLRSDDHRFELLDFSVGNRG
jgi:hypothetical protein